MNKLTPSEFLNRSWITASKKFENSINKDVSKPCWKWESTVMSAGYGYLRTPVLTMLAHRFSYVLHYGDIDDNLVICHTCDNRWCVNPDHLFMGNHQDNAVDMVNKGRQYIVRMIGEDNPAAALTWDKVRKIRSEYIEVKSIRKLAKKYQVGYSTVQRVINNVTWKE